MQLTFPPVQAFGGVRSLSPVAGWEAGQEQRAARRSGEPRALYAGEQTDEDAPNWSPDGNGLLFVRYWLDQEGDTTAAAICRYDLRANRAVKVAGTEGMGPPAWSPDGSLLLRSRPISTS